MARGRFISKDTAEDLEFHELSSDTCRLAYVLLITQADAEGKITGDLDYLASKLFPRRREITEEIVKGFVLEWANAGFAVWYLQSNGHKAIWLINFDKHQIGLRKDREPDSQYESPFDCQIIAGKLPDSDRQNDEKDSKELNNKELKELKDLSIKVKENSTKIPAEIPQKSGVNYSEKEKLERYFEQITNLVKPSENFQPKKVIAWENALTIWAEIGATEADIKAAVEESDKSGMTLVSTASITSFIKSAIARRKRGVMPKKNETAEEMVERLMAEDRAINGKDVIDG